MFEQSGIMVNDAIFPTKPALDELIWECSNSGSLIVNEAYHQYREKCVVIEWHKKIWQLYIPPKISIFLWKCLYNRLPTEENANNRGVIVDRGCAICDDTTILENQDHILIQCNFARALWSWISSLLQLDLSFIGK